MSATLRYGMLQRGFRTSAFVSKNVVASSSNDKVSAPAQPEETQVDVISGAPEELKYHSVRIYKPAKTTMQSGTNANKLWRIDFDTTKKWHNPLMGWASR
jgi:NADH dehydrogenase (ubiquinone) Fe-S protein 4